MHIWVHACVYIHIHLASQRRPPVRLGAPVPLWFLAYGIMLGRYFCLLGWLLDMVFIWIGNLFSFESIYSTEKRSGRMGGVGGGHQEHAPICSDMKNVGQHWSPGIDECTKVPLHVLSVFEVSLTDCSLDVPFHSGRITTGWSYFQSTPYPPALQLDG